jgi:hypothetical protein
MDHLLRNEDIDWAAIGRSNQWPADAFNHRLSVDVIYEYARRSVSNEISSGPRFSTRTAAIERDILRALLRNSVEAGHG